MGQYSKSSPLLGNVRTLDTSDREELKLAHFKISFESRRCCNVREQVAEGSTVREKRPRSCVQCKVERFDQVQGLQRFCPDLPHDSRSFVLC
jgi:hypothetical protein